MQITNKIICFLLLMIHTSLSHGQVDSTKKPETDQAELLKSISSYMECDECTDGELNRVLKFKKEATPILIKILENGPSETRLALYRKSLEAQYAKTKKDDTSVVNKEKYVVSYLNRLKNLYYQRSAYALSKIGGPDVKNALQKAAVRPDLDALVKKYITELLKSL